MHKLEVRLTAVIKWVWRKAPCYSLPLHSPEYQLAPQDTPCNENCQGQRQQTCVLNLYGYIYFSSQNPDYRCRP